MLLIKFVVMKIFSFRNPTFLFIIFFYLILCLTLFAVSIRLNNIVEIPQFLGFTISSILFSYGIINFLKNGSNSYNVFILFYFGFFTLSLFMLSRHQQSLTLNSFHYVFTGPFIIVFFLYLAENLRIKKIKFAFFQFNPNALALSLLVLLIVLKGFIFFTKGVRLFSFLAGDFPGGEEFTIPIITGLSNVTFWLCIFMVPYVKNSLKILIILSTVVIAILIVKRGDLMREVVFLGLLFFTSHGTSIFNLVKKNIFKILAIITFTVLSFSYIGNQRQSYDIEFSINNMLKSEVNNEAFNWFYGYTAFNFQVLNLYIEDERPKSMVPFYASMPIINFFNKKSIESYAEKDFWMRVEGFNASPFQSKFIKDMGAWYFFECIIYGLLLLVVITLCRSLNSFSVYIFVLMLIAFSFFGAYFFIPQYFYAVFIGILLTSITKKSDLSHA